MVSHNEVHQLLERKEQLKRKIINNLDLLIGSIVKAPSHSGYYLTDKVDGKTVTRYIRRSMLEKAGRMTVNHRRVRQMARELSRVNFELLRQGAV